ncbi:MAG TPA: nitrite/sulfite reductase [Bryobacteraceae bacterium]|jgi:sulfite reductase beta subunit-like hemoprotein|nr:nitrite/sulfite reductase [Bryobacteraceae bacterium]
MAASETLAGLQVIEQEYDRTVRQDIELFRSQAEAFLAGQLTDDQFRAYRLRRGIYGQRQPGVHMVRTKVPGGRLTSRQMRQLAFIADEFGGGKGHLTTRQNMQFHFVPLRRVPDLLHALADVRLTTREACYNTVRNVTACPLAGLHPEEPFDVQPYARRLAFAFLHKELTDSLPRKFKVAFSGCPEDCMATAINDVGLRAVIRDGVGGFRMTIAGGLGPLPTEARLLHEFIPAEDVVRRVEAVIRVFNRHGNRNNKNKARLKFVLRERGFDWLRDAIAEEYANILRDGGIPMPDEVPDGFGGFQAEQPPLGSGRKLPVFEPAPAGFHEWRETNVQPQKQAGYSIVTVRVDQGNLTGDQMRGLADLADQAGDGKLRFTMNQNAILAYVPEAMLNRVYGSLSEHGLDGARANEISDVTTCPGAYSCNLALTKAMGLGAAIAQAVREDGDSRVRALKINISGCPNSCGQHWIGDIGLYGNARKIEGREVPYYLMLLGGSQHEFGLAIQSLPARLAPVAVLRVLDHFKANHQPGESFRQYVLRHKVETFRRLTADLVKPAELSPEMYRDWGDEVDYSLELGRGECAA